MKKLVIYPLAVIMLLVVACQGDSKSDNYADQISKKHSSEQLLKSINMSIDEVAKKESKESLQKEEEDMLVYQYNLGEGETYEVRYVFDNLGCFEVGVDTQIKLAEQTKNVKEGWLNYFNQSSDYTKVEDANQLISWDKNDGKVTVELDYALEAEGVLTLTIFANE